MQYHGMLFTSRKDAWLSLSLIFIFQETQLLQTVNENVKVCKSYLRLLWRNFILGSNISEKKMAIMSFRIELDNDITELNYNVQISASKNLKTIRQPLSCSFCTGAKNVSKYPWLLGCSGPNGQGQEKYNLWSQFLWQLLLFKKFQHPYVDLVSDSLL